MSTESITVILLKNEQDSLNALGHLHQLNEREEIRLGNVAMIRKKENGEFENLKVEKNGAGKDTFIGFAIGSLATFLTGPLLFLIGSLAGTAIGAAVGHSETKIDKAFIGKVKDCIQPGDIALIANCEEIATGVLDESIKNYSGALLYRTTVS